MSNDNPRLILEDAKALIADPNHWCTRTMASNEAGEFLQPADPKATKWCVIGAIHKAGASHTVKNVSKALDIVYESAPDYLPTAINDYGSHKDVMDLCDKAIARAYNFS